jgi:hypothetical protein
MKRETRDKFASGTHQADLTTGNACWETPPAIFAKLHADFGPFDLDLTADARRHLCPMWFGPNSPSGWTDALIAPWSRFGTRGYSNPPYGPFVQQLLREARAHALLHGFTSVLLLPMRATKAFHAHVLAGASELLFCDKRIVFFEHGSPRLNPRTGKPDGALFDSIVVIFRPDRQALTAGAWKVPPHVFSADIERAKAIA